MPPAKSSLARQFKGKSGRKRRSQLMQARDIKRSKLTDSVLTSTVSTDVSGTVSPTVGVAENESMPDKQTMQTQISSSASKLRRFSKDGEPDFVDNAEQKMQRTWLFAECGQLDKLLADIHCPNAECAGTLTITSAPSMGMAVELKLACSLCNYTKTECSSPKVNNNDHRRNAPYEINRQCVLYTHEIGSGYRAIQKLSTTFGFPVMSHVTFSTTKQNSFYLHIL